MLVVLNKHNFHKRNQMYTSQLEASVKQTIAHIFLKGPGYKIFGIVLILLHLTVVSFFGK